MGLRRRAYRRGSHIGVCHAGSKSCILRGIYLTMIRELRMHLVEHMCLAPDAQTPQEGQHRASLASQPVQA